MKNPLYDAYAISIKVCLFTAMAVLGAGTSTAGTTTLLRHTPTSIHVRVKQLCMPMKNVNRVVCGLEAIPPQPWDLDDVRLTYHGPCWASAAPSTGPGITTGCMYRKGDGNSGQPNGAVLVDGWYELQVHPEVDASRVVVRPSMKVQGNSGDMVIRTQVTVGGTFSDKYYTGTGNTLYGEPIQAPNGAWNPSTQSTSVQIRYADSVTLKPGEEQEILNSQEKVYVTGEWEGVDVEVRSREGFAIGASEATCTQGVNVIARKTKRGRMDGTLQLTVVTM